jgi:tetratricopeptide (TPR) repeat protein
MKKLISLWILLIQIFATQAEDVDFTEANKAYKNKDYNKAIELYIQLSESGLMDANLYYNMGNTYCKLDDYAQAIYYYEKAAKINPRDKDIGNNLSFAYQKISNKYPDIAINYPNSFLDNLVSKCNTSQWTKFMVIFLWIGFMGFILHLFLKSPRLKKYLFVLTSTVFLCSFFFLVMTFLRIQQDKVNQFVIVFTDNIYSKSNPSYSADNVYTLVEGQKLKIIDHSGEWIKVRNGKGDEGWMVTQNAKII